MCVDDDVAGGGIEEEEAAPAVAADAAGAPSAAQVIRAVGTCVDDGLSGHCLVPSAPADNTTPKQCRITGIELLEEEWRVAVDAVEDIADWVGRRPVRVLRTDRREPGESASQLSQGGIGSFDLLLQICAVDGELWGQWHRRRILLDAKVTRAVELPLDGQSLRCIEPGRKGWLVRHVDTLRAARAGEFAGDDTLLFGYLARRLPAVGRFGGGAELGPAWGLVLWDVAGFLDAWRPDRPTPSPAFLSAGGLFVRHGEERRAEPGAAAPAAATRWDALRVRVFSPA